MRLIKKGRANRPFKNVRDCKASGRLLLFSLHQRRLKIATIKVKRIAPAAAAIAFINGLLSVT